jgi:hypothetical protein
MATQIVTVMSHHWLTCHIEREVTLDFDVISDFHYILLTSVIKTTPQIVTFIEHRFYQYFQPIYIPTPIVSNPNLFSKEV